MIPLLNEQLFMSLAHAAQHPDKSLLHPIYKPIPVTHVTTKNAMRVHKLRKNKTQDKSVTVSQVPLSSCIAHSSISILDSIAEEISLARDVAHELYVDKEITLDDWKSTKELLKKFSSDIVKKKDKLV